MERMKLPLVVLLTFATTCWVWAGLTSAHDKLVPGQLTHQSSTALERGYRTGYSDGYQAGYKDVADRSPRDFRSKEEYRHADRAYVEAWGPIEDYRDGYRQGFEAGYAAGFDRQPFNSSIPSELKRRGTADAQNDTTAPGDSNRSATGVPATTSSAPVNPSGGAFITSNSIFLIELQSSLSTEATKRNDRFEARVLEPRDFQGAIIEGRVSSVKRPGRVKGTARLQLSFEEIRLPDNRTGSFHADVVEVLGTPARSGVGDVDPEGGVKGRDSTKDDVSKVAATAGVGAVIGAIAGGGKGTAIGAAIGGAVGTGGVLTQRGKDIHLERGQQLRIRTSTDTDFQ